LAICASGLLVSACSSNPGYPAVLENPTPRGEATMSQDQIKQATDALISDRNELSAQAPANGQANPANGAMQASAPATGQPNPPNGSTQASAPASTGSTRAAGASTKP
jgi:hypothetical protein